jgi:TatD DNase family protein
LRSSPVLQIGYDQALDNKKRNMTTTIIDSHAHLDWESFKEDRDIVIQRAWDADVSQIVQAGVYLNAIPDMLKLAEEHANIHIGIGLHPHEAKDWNEQSEQQIRQGALHPKVVGIGECGLDFHYNHSERETQLSVFAKQVDLARELKKPLIIHTRNAWEETFSILKDHGKGEITGVFHCFSGGPEVLPEIRDLDFYVSFSGIVTFPKATDIQAAAPLVPIERILVETDCPYLAPQGMRGKRNEPANVWLVAQKIAELRSTSKDEIAAQTSANARRLFNLPSV